MENHAVCPQARHGSCPNIAQCGANLLANLLDLIDSPGG